MRYQYRHFQSTHCKTMPRQLIRRRLTETEMARGMVMLEAGASQRHVATSLNVTQSVISRLWHRYQTTESVSHRLGGGGQRITTPQDDHYLTLLARRNPFLNATQLQRDLQTATGHAVSTQAVRRRLHEVGFRSRAAPIRVTLTRNHMQARRAWARDRVNWTVADWTPVLFTDESRFYLDVTDRKRRVWRQRNQRSTSTTSPSTTVTGVAPL